MKSLGESAFWSPWNPSRSFSFKNRSWTMFQIITFDQGVPTCLAPGGWLWLKLELKNDPKNIFEVRFCIRLVASKFPHLARVSARDVYVGYPSSSSVCLRRRRSVMEILLMRGSQITCRTCGSNLTQSNDKKAQQREPPPLTLILPSFGG